MLSSSLRRRALTPRILFPELTDRFFIPSDI
jgi:hypothetical protein